MWNRLKKIMLGAKLRAHGICPKHGERVPPTIGCLECVEEKRARINAAEAAWKVREEQMIEAMLEEYRKL